MAEFEFIFQGDDREPQCSDGHLSSVDAAREAAVQSFAQMLRDEPSKFISDGEWTMAVKTADGLSLFQIIAIAANAPAAMPRP